MEGISDELKKRHFWDFNIGHLILIVGLLATFLVWWSSFSSLPKETASSLSVLAQSVKDINDKGTFGSQMSLQREQSAITSIDARVLALEKNYGQLNEKMTDVQSKINMVAALLEADKKNKK